MAKNSRKRKGAALSAADLSAPVASTSTASAPALLQTAPAPTEASPPSKRRKMAGPAAPLPDLKRNDQPATRNIPTANLARLRRLRNNASRSCTAVAEDGSQGVERAAKAGDSFLTVGATTDEDTNDTPNTTPEHIELGDEEVAPIVTEKPAAKKDKGKGKQVDPQPPRVLSGRWAAMEEDMRRMKEDAKKMQEDMQRMEERLAQKDETLDVHRDFMKSIRSHLNCSICLETLESPYALACGHIFCHRDLYGWFHRADPEAAGFDPDSEDEANHHYGHQSGFLAAHPFPNAANNHAAAAGNGQPQRPAPPIMLPATRRRNLICPSCREPCADAPPAQLFAVHEAVEALRKVEIKLDSAARRAASEAQQSVPNVAHGPEAHRDEKDKTWGHIWGFGRGEGRAGGHPMGRAERYVVVRDEEDGVRRCGSCNWEIEADGICQGCGLMYSDTEDSDSLAGQSDNMGRSEDEATRYATDEEHSERSDVFGEEEDAEDFYVEDEREARRQRRHQAYQQAVNDEYPEGEEEEEEDAYEDDGFIVRDEEQSVEGSEQEDEDDDEDDHRRRRMAIPPAARRGGYRDAVVIEDSDLSEEDEEGEAPVVRSRRRVVLVDDDEDEEEDDGETEEEEEEEEEEEGAESEEASEQEGSDSVVAAGAYYPEDGSEEEEDEDYAPPPEPEAPRHHRRARRYIEPSSDE